ncbi:MAG: hypothetical protein FWC79_08900 [Oscillospiraceae bacterium]|nr:hypothetical protein [Oscillospiraceae bacterium]
MQDYTFERLWQELDGGYQIFYTYMDRRYLLTKLQSNCYSKELLTEEDKSPHPKKLIVTLKSVKETFPFMEDIEYKVN